MPSLLDFAGQPTAAQCPLPPLAARRRTGAWPVGLLPIDRLAEDLTRRGLEYRRGSGFSIAGEPIDDYEAARLTAVTLQIAAESLHLPRPRSAILFEHAAPLDAETDRLQAEAHRETDDYEAAELLFRVTSTGARALISSIRTALEAPDALVEDREANTGDTWKEHAQALARTARDVKASPTVQGRMLQLLRRSIPAPADRTEDDRPSAEDFLASLDGQATLRRSALVALYADAGYPGGLSPDELRALASTRWGAPRKLQGIYTYRPARAKAAN
ncbi:hypothetical protein ACIQF8_20285 [Pseudarthrobacter sp. NPDC092184]|uniref:hypothetical protein n=1 Tax=unclassified Pseudarthrobacter TaxID=2647000 RepID=UPI003800F64D